jgi:hypothetical protein
MAQDKGYQGWSNYETWLLALWIDNEEGSYRRWRERAKELMEDEWADYTGAGVTKQEQREGAAMRLSEELKESVEENNPLAEGDEGGGFYADLLSAALSEVNWFEIAMHILDE